VPAPGGLRHVQRQVAHPLEALRRVDRGQHAAQVGGDRRLQGQQRVRVLLAGRPRVVHLLVVADHLLGELQIGLQERPGGELHRRRDHRAHAGELHDELPEFDLVGLTHECQPTAAGAHQTQR
jgi:hypothetical protein